MDFILASWLFVLTGVGLSIAGLIIKRFTVIIASVLVLVIGFAYTATANISKIIMHGTAVQVANSTTTTSIINYTTTVNNTVAYNVVMHSYYPAILFAVVSSVIGAFYLFARRA